VLFIIDGPTKGRCRKNGHVARCIGKGKVKFVSRSHCDCTSDVARMYNADNAFTQGVEEQVEACRYTVEEGRSKGRGGDFAAIRHVSMLRSRFALEILVCLFSGRVWRVGWLVTVRKLTRVAIEP
jgi:hypothetical protein